MVWANRSIFPVIISLLYQMFDKGPRTVFMVIKFKGAINFRSTFKVPPRCKHLNILSFQLLDDCVTAVTTVTKYNIWLLLCSMQTIYNYVYRLYDLIFQGVERTQLLSFLNHQDTQRLLSSRPFIGFYFVANALGSAYVPKSSSSIITIYASQNTVA